MRFDPADKAYMTSKGTKKNPSSYIPFLAGKRVCFGKTFAETNLKVIGSFLAMYFDYKMVDERFK